MEGGSESKPPLWTYRPIPARRLSRDGGSRAGPSLSIQRSSSLAPEAAMSLHEDSDYSRRRSLSSKITDFLHRTDYTSHEWRKMARSSTPRESVNRSQSSHNIFMSNNTHSNRNSVASSCDRTLSEADEEELSRDDCSTGEFDLDDRNGSTISLVKYENLKKDLEFSKKQMKERHELEMDHFMCLKKQLEKKLADAYEELDEQKNLVNQWKRKHVKAASELGDLKATLDQQIKQTKTIEKKQIKVNTSCQQLMDQLNEERNAKEKIIQEKEFLANEKNKLQDALELLKMDMDQKTFQIRNMSNELKELEAARTEWETISLKHQRSQLESKYKVLEKDLEDATHQLEVLENIRMKHELTIEEMRKKFKKELLQKEEEVEEIRCSNQKKIKALMYQLENEYSERSSLVRDKYELEKKFSEASEATTTLQCSYERQIIKLKKDLKKFKVLLRDADQALQQKSQANMNKGAIRQFKIQLEDLEMENQSLSKSKQMIQAELSEVLQHLESVTKQKTDVEQKHKMMFRERESLMARIEELEDELSEVLNKYKNVLTHLSSLDEIIQEQTYQITHLEEERASLKEQLMTMQFKMDDMENISSSAGQEAKAYQIKIKELESVLDFDQAMILRIEGQLSRSKTQLEKALSDIQRLEINDLHNQETIKQLTKQINDLRRDNQDCLNHEYEMASNRRTLERKCESLESDNQILRSDLKIALLRIEDFQVALMDFQNSEFPLSECSSDSETATISQVESLPD